MTDTPRDLIARFAVGIEAVDDGIGEVQIIMPGGRGDLFIVRMVGGVMPDSEKHFDSAAPAFDFAMQAVQEQVLDTIETIGTGDAQ